MVDRGLCNIQEAEHLQKIVLSVQKKNSVQKKTRRLINNLKSNIYLMHAVIFIKIKCNRYML